MFLIFCVIILNIGCIVNEIVVPLRRTSSIENCISALVAEYLGDSPATMVISNGEDLSFLKEVNIPVTIRTVLNYTSSIRDSSVIVLIKDIDLEPFLRNLFRSHLTKFIILTDEERISNITLIFWKLRILFVLMLVPKSGVIEVYTYYPFGVKDCNALTKPFIVNQWDENIGKFRSTWTELKKPKDVNLMRCPLNISFMDFPPFVMRDRNEEVVTRLYGIEGNIMEEIAGKFNFTPNYINRHETEWGSHKPPSGLTGDVYTSVSDFGFGVLYPFEIRYQIFDGAMAYFFVDSSDFVTPIGSGKVLPKWVSLYYREFTGYFWMGLAISLIFSSFFIRYLNLGVFSATGHTSPNNNALIMFFAFFGEYIERGKIWPVRFYMSTWLLFGFVVTAAYQSSMSSQLTAPSEPPEINTGRELVDSTLHLTGPYLGLKLLAIGGEDKTDDDETDKVIAEIVAKAEAIPTSVSDILLQIVRHKNVSYMHHVNILKYYAVRLKEVIGKVHFVEEVFYPHYPVMVLQKYSYFTDEANKVISDLNKGGMIVKWANDIFPNYKKDTRNDPRQLAVRDIYMLFIVLVSGWTLSLIVFVLEILHKRMKREIAKV